MPPESSQGVPVLEATQPETLQQLDGPGLEIGPPAAEEFGRDQHIVEDRAPIEQHVALEDDAELIWRPLHRLTIDRHRSCADRLQARHTLQQCALTAA